MSVKVVTNFGVLMRYAKALGNAKKSGDAEAIERAQAEHDSYHALCKSSDEMSLDVTRGELDRPPVKMSQQSNDFSM